MLDIWRRFKQSYGTAILWPWTHGENLNFLNFFPQLSKMSLHLFLQNSRRAQQKYSIALNLSDTENPQFLVMRFPFSRPNSAII